MRRLYPLLLVAMFTQAAFTCEKSEEVAPAEQCATPATVRMTGLDGCGYTLELQNGLQLEPHGKTWSDYPKREGEQVFVSYTNSNNQSSICMVGQPVIISCIRPALVDWCGTGR